MNIYFYLSYYFLLLFSIIGYGSVFKSIFLKKEKINLGYLGIFGILLLTILGYSLNFFIPLSSNLNLLILTVGIIFFIKLLIDNFTSYRKDFFTLIIIFIFLIVFILSAKNHDDFPYYHFSYINILTQMPSSFGLGNFNHGFRTPSSIFYLSSFFYLPKTNYNLIHFAPAFFLGFANFIFVNKIYLNIKNKENFYIILLSLFSLALINVFFYRMAEHGTDRSAQIIILLIFTEVIEFMHKENLDKNLLNKIIILITIAVSLKAFYLIYALLFLPLIVIQKDKIIFFLQLIKNKIFILCFIFFLILISINFFNTGCLIYPLAFTCNETLLWSIPINAVNYMNEWYHLWSKGGAVKNFEAVDRAYYISHFNWLNNWIEVYFFNKVSDYLLGLLFLTILFFTFFFQKKLKYRLSFNKNFFLLYFILILLSLEWFYNHPSLRYGGYHLIALLIFLPVSIFLDNQIIFNKKLVSKINIILVIILITFLSRNINRISKEVRVYNYNFIENASYNENFKNYKILERIEKIKKCTLKNNSCEDEYIKSSKIRNKHLFYQKK
tara:strand:- start:1136 stop:2794 length:1659 start_codon:yes stop_codon:yes gene_type:complete